MAETHGDGHNWAGSEVIAEDSEDVEDDTSDDDYTHSSGSSYLGSDVEFAHDFPPLYSLNPGEPGGFHVVLPDDGPFVQATHSDSEESGESQLLREDENATMPQHLVEPFYESPGSSNPDSTQLSTGVHDLRTIVTHHQCCDALCAIDQRYLVCAKTRSALVVYDTKKHTMVGPRHAVGFDVYGVSVQDALSLIAVGGSRRAEGVNAAVYRYQITEDEPGSTLELLDAAYLDTDMVNSVRFGYTKTSGGTLAPMLIAGLQNDTVQVFPVLSVVDPTGFRKSSIALNPKAPDSFHFDFPPGAVNCASSSPDGRWLAMVGDSSEVHVHGGDRGYQTSHGCNKVVLDYLPEVDESEAAACQYVAWSGNSQFLAASSDAPHNYSVVVWRVSPTRGASREDGEVENQCGEFFFEKIAVFIDHNSPCLALRFSAARPSLLIWTEKDGLVFCCDLSGESLEPDEVNFHVMSEEFTAVTSAIQRVEVPGRAISGLTVAEDAVFIASTDFVTEYRVLTEWNSVTHCKFPEMFRDAVKVLLLASARGGKSPEVRGIWSLPEAIVHSVLKLSAFPLDAWTANEYP
ncbi:hypothetical protein CYMTET_29775 [Cymbomonas tetramitiformis]|uniref:Uncharacterized protein n=1 Tax=Cymbomonas tetramitiformis TaxID=36881 RepID=A0AAE0FKD8_9CHLO|nr:hypothetical protein CYMTET_52103 [Cymbomonas tetramitiformis]KAK3261312.1 hypothetical protein CYMTET_29775 [Cymbomonas tetramitiformis]|eukprot:gene24761-30156_t